MVREKDGGVHSLQAWLPETVEISLRDVLVAKDGLLALSTTVGLQVMRRMMEAEVTAVVEPDGKHLPRRRTYRHGQAQGWVVLGGRKVAIQRPRVRTVDGEEVPLRTTAWPRDATGTAWSRWEKRSTPTATGPRRVPSAGAFASRPARPWKSGWRDDWMTGGTWC